MEPTLEYSTHYSGQQLVTAYVKAPSIFGGAAISTPIALVVAGGSRLAAALVEYEAAILEAATQATTVAIAAAPAPEPDAPAPEFGPA